MTDWEFICTIPILDGLEWELSYLMDHPELVGGVEEPVSGDGYSCPSVHTVQLKNDQGQDAFLGWLVRIHGQLGHMPNYWGIFSDREKFYSELRKSGFLFYDEKDTLSDRQILLLWKLDIS